MFDYFGGVPRRLIFDNAKVAVREGFGLRAKATEGYAAFAAHYAFKTDFCNIASGNEKGLVENLVGYARHNFMVPVPKAKSLSELNEYLIRSCTQYRKKHRVAGRKETVEAAYQTECKCLNPIPLYRFDTSRTVTAKVNDYSLIKFDKNHYSVPIRYLRKTVTIKGYANEVKFLYGGKEITSFRRLYGSGKTDYRLEHYIDLLERKPRSVFQAKPVRKTVTEELIDWGKHLPEGNKEMVRLLRLCVDYGQDRILSIKSTFPAGVTPTVNMIRSQLHEDPKPETLSIQSDINVISTDLSKFDTKCGVV